MPTDIGNQKITLLYFSPANSADVNRRFINIRQLGIYKGGYLSIVDTSNAQISLLVCEISDGTHQIRGETTSAVNIAVASGTSYVVLRWAYVGNTSDYMQILAVATPDTNDLVIGKCSFTGGGDLQGFTYSERSTPNTQDLFLKVEAPDSTMVDKMKVRVRAGRIRTNASVVSINDQPTPFAFTHSGGGLVEYGFVYIDTSGNVQIIDANGNTSVPLFNGKMVLAIVAITSASSVITQDMITNTRNWITPPVIPDNVTIEKNSSGLLQVIKSYILGLIPTSPRWSVKVAAANNYTLPAQFVSPIAQFSLSTYGSIDFRSGSYGQYYANNSILYTMTVNSVGSQTKNLKLFSIDNWVYIYVGGVLVYSKYANWQSQDAPINIPLNFVNGNNLVQIVWADIGSIYALCLVGDIVDDINVKFVSP